jgi:putative salt-induced outer membrane protein YdiY
MALAAKTDKVTLENGDVVTCEIKRLERGRLRVSTDSIGTVYIEWDEVVAATSEQPLLVETASGERSFGNLTTSPNPGFLRIGTGNDAADVPLDRVVRVTPIKDSFLNRLDGDFKVGYSYTKASDVAQLSFGANLIYRERRYRASLSASSITTDNNNDTTKKNDLVGDYRYFLRNRWFALGVAGLQQNDELGLDLRSYVGGGVGRNVIQTNRWLLALLGGVTVNRENQSDEGNQDSVEGFVGFDLDLFRYNTPKRDVNMTYQLIPSITESGRVRQQFDTSVKFEIVEDFFLDLSFYATRDNQSPEGAASDTDYGIITSLGYSL